MNVQKSPDCAAEEQSPALQAGCPGPRWQCPLPAPAQGTGTLHPPTAAVVFSPLKSRISTKMWPFYQLPAVQWGVDNPITLPECHLAGTGAGPAELLLSPGLAACTSKATSSVTPAKVQPISTQCLCQKEFSLSAQFASSLVHESCLTIFSQLEIFLLSTPQIDGNINLGVFFQDTKQTCISFSFAVSREAASSNAKVSTRHRTLNIFYHY